MQIQITRLSKRYAAGVQALLDVDLDIGSGMFGLLGPNGAGKSTLMKILATLEAPTSGSLLLDGHDIQTHRKMVRESLGYLPQEFGVYPQLTGAEFLNYIGRLNRLSGERLRNRVDDILHSVSLYDVRDRKAKTYSGGMMRRLGIAQALVADPKILIVDEPTVGLDPEERIRFRNLITEISHDKIVILSTHIVGDISSTCRDLALLAHGQVIFRGPPEELVATAKSKVWLVFCEEQDFRRIAEEIQIISTVQKDRQLQLRAIGEQMAGVEMQPAEPNLEDAYIHYMALKTGDRLS